LSSVRFAAPTLILGGGATSFVPQSDLALAAQLIPACRLVTIEGAGHQVHATRTAEFVEQVRDFLDAERL
jgi:pimeloyl-ACP methyl ester carboxylesterase